MQNRVRYHIRMTRQNTGLRPHDCPARAERSVHPERTAGDTERCTRQARSGQRRQRRAFAGYREKDESEFLVLHLAEVGSTAQGGRAWVWPEPQPAASMESGDQRGNMPWASFRDLKCLPF